MKNDRKLGADWGKMLVFMAAICVLSLIVAVAVLQYESGSLLPGLAILGFSYLILVACRPVVGVIAVLAFSFLNPSLLPVVADFGDLSVRYVDLFYSALILVLCLRLAATGKALLPYDRKRILLPIIPFLLYVAVSVIRVSYSFPDSFGDSVASYLRLLVSTSLSIVVTMLVCSESSLRALHKAFLVLAISSVIIGGVEATSSAGLTIEGSSAMGSTLSGRFGGLLGFNSLGLVAGLLVIYATALKRKKLLSMHGVVILVVGLGGLYLAKSASSIMATVGVIAVQIGSASWKQEGVPNPLRWVVIGGTAVILGSLGLWALRGADVSGLLDLTGGSFAMRMMIAYAGLGIFIENPVLGVGWQISRTEAIIGSASSDLRVAGAFSQLPGHYFSVEYLTSLHNLYIQILAELGGLGITLFAFGCISCGREIRRLIREIPADSAHREWGRFYAFGLLFLLLWWNTNALFGGQTETMLAFLFLGMLGSLARLERPGVKIDRGIE